MTTPCDPATACCLPEQPWPDSDLASFPGFPAAPVQEEEVRLDTYTTLDRIEGGEEVIRSLPLPWGHAGLFKVPILGEVFLHVARDATVRTVEPVRLGPGGVIQSGLLQFMGDVGLTFNKRYERGGVPLLFRIETIRFEKGRIFLKFVTMPEAIQDETPPLPFGDYDAEAGMGVFNLALHLGLRWYMGPSNSRGEYDLWPFIQKRGWTPYFGGLQLSRLARFLRRKGEIGSKVVSVLNPPDYHRFDTSGFLRLRNPIFHDPRTEETIQIGDVTNEIHPQFTSQERRLDAVRFGVGHVLYENRANELQAAIEGLEFAIRDDFDFKGPLDFRGSGEIRWEEIRLYGPRQTKLALGCAIPPCRLPQRVSFSFTMTPAGLRLHLDSTENQIYTPEARIVGRILPSFLDLAVRLYRERDASGVERIRIRDVPLSGAIAVDASTRKPIDLTRTLRAGAEGVCQLEPESDNLLSGDFQVGFNCMAGSGRLEWYNEAGEMGLRLQIPRGTESVVQGVVQKKGDQVVIEMPHWASHLDLDAPLIVKAMELIAKTTGERPHMRNVRVAIHPDGTKEFLIEMYRGHLQTNLRSPFFENPMESDLTVVRLKTVMGPGGSFRMESEDPRRNRYFLSTEARGEIRLPTVFTNPITIHHGRLNVSRIDFDYARQQASFRGEMEIHHDNVPEDFLERRFRIRSPSGRPQVFRVKVTANHWTLNRSGVVEIHSGDVDVEAVDTEARPRPAAREAESPRMLTAAIPPLETVSGAEENSLFTLDGLVHLAAGLFGAVSRINRFDVRTPEGPGEPEVVIPLPAIPIILPRIPALREALTLSLRLPQGTTWHVETETRPHPETGDESFTRFVIRPERPIRVCVNLFGHCVTQEDVRFEKVELVTTDPPFPEFDFMNWRVPEEPAGPRAGELVLHWGLGVQPPLAKMLLEGAGIDEETAERHGLVIRHDQWRLPIRLRRMQDLVQAIDPRRIGEGEEMQNLASNVMESPRIRWAEATGDIDLLFRGGVRELCTQSPGPHPHLFVRTRTGSHLTLSRQEGNGPIRMGTLAIPTLGAVTGVDHSDRARPIRVTADLPTPQSPFFAFFHDLVLENPVIDPFTRTVETRFRVREIPFRVGRPEGPYRWSGAISDVRGERVVLSHPGDITRVSMGEMQYRFLFQKEPSSPGGSPGFFPVEFRGNPRFTRPFLDLLPGGRLRIGYEGVQDEVTFIGPHFEVRDLAYTARGTSMTTQLTDDVVKGDVLIQVPEIEIQRGQVILGPGGLQVARPSHARGTTLLVRDENADFSSEHVDMTLSGVVVDFVRRLGLPDGFEIEDLQLEDLHMEGPIGPSSLRRRDLDIRGPGGSSGTLRLETRGRVRFRYANPANPSLRVRNFESPIEVRMGALRRMKTSGGKLELLEFEGFEIDLADVETTVTLLNFLRTRIESIPEIAPSRGTLHIKTGRIEISRQGPGERPRVSLRLEGISFDMTGRSRDSAMEFRRGSRGVRIGYPDLRVTVAADDAVFDGVREDGRWRANVTVGPLRMRVRTHHTRIETRE